MNFKFINQSLPEFAATFQDAMEKLIEQHLIAEESLTRKQLANVILQALACGDIKRLVVAGSTAQSMVYVPFARKQELESKVRALKEALEKIRDYPINVQPMGDEFGMRFIAEEALKKITP